MVNYFNSQHNSSRLMKSLTPFPWPDVQSDFELHRHGKILVRESSSCFGFQIAASNPVPHPTLYFALHQEPSGAANKPVQFGVRIDLESGEIWDMANRSGVIGTLDCEALQSDLISHPLSLRWEVEHTGSVLIPRLHIGHEEWLYPSLLFPGECHFVATTGHNLRGTPTSTVFSPGYVWCQDHI